MHLIQLCVDQPRFLPYHQNNAVSTVLFLRQEVRPSPRMKALVKHFHKNFHSEEMSRQHLEDPQHISCTTTGGFTLFSPSRPTASRLKWSRATGLAYPRFSSIQARQRWCMIESSKPE